MGFTADMPHWSSYAMPQHLQLMQAYGQMANDTAQQYSDSSKYAQNPFEGMPSGESWANLSEMAQDRWEGLQDLWAKTGEIPGMSQVWEPLSIDTNRQNDYSKKYRYGYAFEGGQESMMPGAQNLQGLPKPNAPKDFYQVMYGQPQGYYKWTFPNLLDKAAYPYLWENADTGAGHYDDQAMSDLEKAYSRYYTPPSYSYNPNLNPMASGAGGK